MFLSSVDCCSNVLVTSTYVYVPMCTQYTYLILGLMIYILVCGKRTAVLVTSGGQLDTCCYCCYQHVRIRLTVDLSNTCTACMYSTLS